MPGRQSTRTLHLPDPAARVASVSALEQVYLTEKAIMSHFLRAVSWRETSTGRVLLTVFSSSNGTTWHG